MAQQTRREAGFSLPELIITMMLLGIAMTLVVGMFVSFSGVFNREREATDNANQASLIMDTTTKVIRSGTPLGPSVPGQAARPAFIIATANKLEIYSNVSDNASTIRPSIIRLEVVSDGTFVESRWNPQSSSEPWKFPGTTTRASTTRIAGTRVKNASSFFVYHQRDGTVLPTPITGSNLALISTVTVTATVGTATGRANPLTVSNHIRLPNLPVAGL